MSGGPITLFRTAHDWKQEFCFWKFLFNVFRLQLTEDDKDTIDKGRLLCYPLAGPPLGHPSALQSRPYKASLCFSCLSVCFLVQEDRKNSGVSIHSHFSNWKGDFLPWGWGTCTQVTCSWGMAWGLARWRAKNRDKTAVKPRGFGSLSGKQATLFLSPKPGLDGQPPSPMLLPGIGLYLVQAGNSRSRNESPTTLVVHFILISSITYQPELEFQKH